MCLPSLRRTRNHHDFRLQASRKIICIPICRIPSRTATFRTRTGTSLNVRRSSRSLRRSWHRRHHREHARRCQGHARARYAPRTSSTSLQARRLTSSPTALRRMLSTAFPYDGHPLGTRSGAELSAHPLPHAFQACMRIRWSCPRIHTGNRASVLAIARLCWRLEPVVASFHARRNTTLFLNELASVEASASIAFSSTSR